MKKILVLACLLGLAFTGCATLDPKVGDLEQKVAKLEKQVRSLQMSGATGAGANIYPVTGALTGGGTGALDKIDATNDKDAAIVMFNAEGTYGNAFMPYTLDEAGGCGTESGPTCIEAYTATEWWELCDVWGMNLYSPGKIKGKIDVIPDADGRSIALGTIASASEILGDIHVATGTGTWTLPDIDDGHGTGWSFCIYSTTDDDVFVDPDTEDKMYYDGTLGGAGKKLTISDAGASLCAVVTSVSSNVAVWTVFPGAKTITLEE